ncbi:MAG TPA: hypothetical protein VN030_05025 [Cellvibrio sp.]|nr:hypothetical protein [Cellvibrio sp.]
MKRFFLLTWLLLSALSITACGGGGSGGGSKPPAATASSAPAILSSSAASVAVSSSSLAISSSSTASSATPTRPADEVTTSYKVTVDVPSSFATQAADGAASTLNANRFAVVLVDVAGNILQKIQLYEGEVALNNDGSWTVSFPGSPRLDYVILVDIAKPIQVTVGGNIRQSDLVYAPVTRTSLDIDVGSTSAYGQFLEGLGGAGSFVDNNFDPESAANIDLVEAIVNNIQTIVAEQSLSGYTSVAAALAGLNAQVASIVIQEVENINTATAGSAVGLIRDEGGMYGFYRLDEGPAPNINYTRIVAKEDPVSYRYQDSTFVEVEPAAADEVLMLGESGWVSPTGGFKALTYNSDGSVTLGLIGATGVNMKVEAQQVFNLAGRNIRDFLLADVETQELASLVNGNSTFASNAKGYRLQSGFVDTLYTLMVDSASDSQDICDTTDENNGTAVSELGGNCNALGLWEANQSYLGPATISPDKIPSADVTPDAETFRAITLFDPVLVQLINNSAKTARFYLRSDSALPRLIGSGTWEQITLPHLQENSTAITVQMTSAVGNEDLNYFLLPDLKYLLVKHEGFVRLGYKDDDIDGDVDMSFNQAAFNSIESALTAGSAQ